MDNLKSIEQRLIHIENLLLSNKSVLTLKEAVEYTGLSRSYLYKLTSAGYIPHSKPNGKQLYFEKNELDAWLLRGKVKATEQINYEAVTYVTINKGGK